MNDVTGGPASGSPLFSCAPGPQVAAGPARRLPGLVRSGIYPQTVAGNLALVTAAVPRAV